MALVAGMVMTWVGEAAANVIIYPAGDGKTGGTLVDGGLYGPFDGVPDAWDWTFNGIGGYEGVLTLVTEPAARPADQRVVWEYDVSALPAGAPFAAFLVFELRGPPIFPFPADLAELPADFSAEPADLVASVLVEAFAVQSYQVNITPAVVDALRSADGKLALRFQIDPDSRHDNNQAFMDVTDADDTTKPAVYSPSVVLGDGNGDGVVTVADLPGLVACMDGPGETVATSCQVFDFDADFDVDGSDAYWFMATHTLFYPE